MRVGLVLALFEIAFACAVVAQTPADPVTAGPLRSYSTIYSIGVEWDVAGDADHDAAAAVQYRIRGAATWHAALPLIRVDYNGANMLSGSVLFLTPDTEYEIALTLTDPDGGGETRTLIVRTRAVPAAPSAGRILHVVPGTGGGNGSPAAPFAGIAAAQAAAVPGDTFLLHTGDYGGRVRFDRAGTATSYVVWKPAGDGEVLLRGIDVAASHIWLEGLTVRDLARGLLSFNSPANVVVMRCQFISNGYAIFLQGAGTDWYVVDNTIVGNVLPESGNLDGEGIDLNVTSGHTLAHNSITHVADGISYPHTNVDIFGNDIFDTSDDGIELDNGHANVRIWGNRVHNAVHNGISFQPQLSGPWYIVRNQIVGSMEAAFKFRTTDRFVLLHNTIVHWGNAYPGSSMMCCNEWDLLKAYARNNLWVSVRGGQIWGFEDRTRDWRTDLDYDGFDWGSSTEPFWYGGLIDADLASFSARSGLEVNGIRISHDSCFSDFDVPGPSPTPVPPHVMTLQPTCAAVDSGVILPNINDTFSGTAPDRGAHEYGGVVATYGPRPPPTSANDEVVLYAAESTTIVGDWQLVTDPSAATGRRLQNPNAGAAKLATPFVTPPSYFELTFNADAGKAYRLWIRGRAEADDWANDSAFVQFDHSVTESGTATYRIGTTSATTYSLENCSGCGVSGWGWQDNGYGAGVLGPAIVFDASGPQRVRIQVREDGLGIDQVVLSAVKYLTAPPGAMKNDMTILPRTGSGGSTNAAPAVSIMSPAANTTFTAPASIDIVADARDSDGTVSRVEFFANGAAIGSRTAAPWSVTWSGVGAGSYSLTAVAADNLAATTTSAPVSVTVTPGSTTDEVVLYAADATTIAGQWRPIADATAAGSLRLQTPDAGAAKLTTPLATPASFFELTFNADAGKPYRLWVRGKAEADHWANDSAFVQFDHSVTESGTPTYRIGTTSATTYSVENCSGCGVSGWGWEDNGYGSGVLGPLIYFDASGPQRLRIQLREDGLGIDQVVLSSIKYVSSSPGALKNDATILPRTGSGSGGTTIDEIVLHARTATIGADWIVTTDSTAAGGARLQNPNLDAAKVATPLASPAKYFELTFHADAGKAYRLWIRSKAESDSWANDSAFVQFDHSVTQSGTPTYRIGTTAATTYILEDCNGCGLSGWGWQDNGYGTGVLGPLIYFDASGPQRLRIHVREDGLGIDQIVLSAVKYLTSAPGAVKGDTTILAPR